MTLALSGADVRRIVPMADLIGLFEALDGRPVFAAKINANVPANPGAHGLPTIQGVIALFDATDGRVPALLDSIEIAILRTAVATAVAAKYLAPPAATVAMVGCGAQSRFQLRDLHHAIDSGAMRREDVRAELAEVVAGTKRGRLSADETVIFDSAGTALEDVAAAALAFDRARSSGAALAIDLSSAPADVSVRHAAGTPA